MADVTGPVSTLPGSRHAAPDGVMCDVHPEVPAVCRVQGETDSFGAELLDLCQACFDEMEKHRDESRTGVSDWCRQQAHDLRPRRDYEEGMYGRVYEVCGACVKNENERLAEELGRSGYYDDMDEE